MLQTLVRGLCRNSSGVILVAGAIGVLAGVEHLMSRRALAQPSTGNKFKRKRPGMPMALDRFSIRRTRSELGYTYWVLQGYGKYSGFALFDTWQEAIDEVQRRTSHFPAVEELAMSSAGAV